MMSHLQDWFWEDQNKTSSKTITITTSLLTANFRWPDVFQLIVFGDSIEGGVLGEFTEDSDNRRKQNEELHGFGVVLTLPPCTKMMSTIYHFDYISFRLTYLAHLHCFVIVRLSQSMIIELNLGDNPFGYPIENGTLTSFAIVFGTRSLIPVGKK